MSLKKMIKSMFLAGAVIGLFGTGAVRAMLSFSPYEDTFVAKSESAIAGDEREEFHQTYPLTPAGRIRVENLNGNVRIKVWDQAAVQLDAVKQAYKRERLAEARIDVNATQESLRIRTIYPDYNQSFTSDERGRYNNPASVDYELTVPRQARLESIELVNGSLDIEGVEGDVRASSINGGVKTRGLKGETKLTTVNGPLEATFALLSEEKPISLTSVNGSVLIVIPSDSNAVIRAGTVHGAISNDFGLRVLHGNYVGHELHGQLGTGGVRIKLGNVNGGIVIKHAQDGKKQSEVMSLLPDKEKEKAKVEFAQAVRESVAQAQVRREAQRELEQAISAAQREIRVAQKEIERTTERQIREEIRSQSRSSARGSAIGRGEGIGSQRLLATETKTFSVVGQPRVNVGTFDGAVIVHGWDKQEVMFNATKRASDDSGLRQLSVQAEQQGGTISLIARSPEGGGSVSFEVYVPRSANVHVSTGDGSLKLEGVSGEIALRTGDGSIEVINGGGRLQVNTGDGRIRVTTFEGEMDARTGDGAITLDGKFAALSARTGDGSITLTVPVDANFTIETNVEELSSEGLTVSEDIAPSPRLKRWKVGRGGMVFALKTGDGKILLLPR